MRSRNPKLITVAAFAAVSSLSIQPPATAAPAEPDIGTQAADCAYEHFCVYDPDGDKLIETASDWSNGDGLAGGASYFNNARPMPGYDHVQLTYKSGDDWTRTRCIHYGNPEGIGDFEPRDYVSIYEIQWRGEC